MQDDEETKKKLIKKRNKITLAAKNKLGEHGIVDRLFEEEEYGK